MLLTHGGTHRSARGQFLGHMSSMSPPLLPAHCFFLDPPAINEQVFEAGHRTGLTRMSPGRVRDHPVMEIVPNKSLSLSLSLSPGPACAKRAAYPEPPSRYSHILGGDGGYARSKELEKVSESESECLVLITVTGAGSTHWQAQARGCQWTPC